MDVESPKDQNIICCKTTNVTKRHLKCGCGVIIVLVFSLLTAVTIIMIKLFSKHPICVTHGCLQAASRTLSYLNPAVDPCEDFYEFSCGNYIKETVIPEDELSCHIFSSMSTLIETQLKLIFNEPIPVNASKPFQMANKLYRACIDTSSIETHGLQTAQQLIKDFGEWPLVEGNKWNESNFDWTQLLIKLRQNGLDYTHFIKMEVVPNDKNTSYYSLSLDQNVPKFNNFLRRKFNSKMVKAYSDYIKEVALAFGANRTLVQNETNLLVEFETELSMVCIIPEDLRNHSRLYNPTSIRDLQRQFPEINWLSYIKGIVNRPNITITDEEVVIVRIPDYLNKLMNLIKETPKRVLANYIFAKTVLSIVPYLTHALRDKEINYYRTFQGVLSRKPRWKECLNIVTNSINIPISSLYIKKYFKNESKSQAENLVLKIKTEFIKVLKKVTWLDEKTRARALEKASSIATHIGYPIELLDDQNINEYYAKMQINVDSYLSAILSVNLFIANREFEKLHNNFNKTDWSEHSLVTEINASYSPEENSIAFPAGILQGSFFDINRPNYMNYGTLGYVIGHEITHGFDDEGMQFDKDGNLCEWWSKNTTDTFKEKAKCIIDQYENYVYPEFNQNLNGINTQGENIADNAGLKVSYLAYLSWVKENGAEPKLPGIDYTPSQMFWISAAQLWCSKYRPEEMLNIILSDNHSPPKYRVIGSLSNSEYFLRDFKCDSNTTMNAKTKCVVW